MHVSHAFKIFAKPMDGRCHGDQGAVQRKPKSSHGGPLEARQAQILVAAANHLRQNVVLRKDCSRTSQLLLRKFCVNSLHKICWNSKYLVFTAQLAITGSGQGLPSHTEVYTIYSHELYGCV